MRYWGPLQPTREIRAWAKNTLVVFVFRYRVPGGSHNIIKNKEKTL